MAGESNATVVSLQAHPAWAAAQRREALVAEAMRRHPAFILREGLATGSEDALAVVRHIGDRRGARPAPDLADNSAEFTEDRVVPLAEDAPADESVRSQVSDSIVIPFLRPLIEFCYPLAVGCIENLPRLLPRKPSAGAR